MQRNIFATVSFDGTMKDHSYLNLTVFIPASPIFSTIWITQTQKTLLPFPPSVTKSSNWKYDSVKVVKTFFHPFI